MPHTSEYRGPERRTSDRREGDSGPSVSRLVALAALISALVGFGAAWGTTTAKMESKVDAKEQMRIETGQDAKILLITEKLERMVPQMERVDVRVSSLYCRTIPADMREGCR
jgi:hypothetical protein